MTTRHARSKSRRRSSLFARGEGAVWLAGGALVICVLLVVGLLVLVVCNGGQTFWPKPLVRLTTTNGGTALGEPYSEERFLPDDQALAQLSPARREQLETYLASDGAPLLRRTLRTGNRSHEQREGFTLVNDLDVVKESRPQWALTIERWEWGPAYGELLGFRVGEELVAATPEAAWSLFERYHEEVSQLKEEARRAQLQTAELDKAQETLRLRVRRIEEQEGANSQAHQEALDVAQELIAAQSAERTRLRERVVALEAQSRRYVLVLRAEDAGEAAEDAGEREIALADIVRAHAPNRLGFFERVGVYLSRWWEFLSGNPREANSEGGVFPAIFGTVVMTLLMTLLVVPFGVLGALYLREYARQGALVSLVRVAVNNLAGVPSIVFGVFGLGFFCYFVGGGIDQVFFSETLPNPTFGKGGLLWASLTLALLTLPVVVVATEEALAAVPNSMREGSYAAGASRWQTIRRIVLPRAMPGIMTGVILAVARGAGEVAPLMLTGAVKQAESLPIDGAAPFLHAQRSFMHLGFHIYDLGFQTSDAKAAEGMVYTTTLLLIGVVLLLNVLAIWTRARLRRAFEDV